MPVSSQKARIILAGGEVMILGRTNRTIWKLLGSHIKVNTSSKTAKGSTTLLLESMLGFIKAIRTRAY